MNRVGLLVVIVFFSSVLQGAAGFGFGIFAVPLLVWAGLDLSTAVTLVAVVSLFQVSTGVIALHRHVRWREVVYASVLRITTLPLGVGLLYWLDGLDPALLKQVLGGVLLLIILLQLLVRPPVRAQLHPGWRILAFSLSGLLMGMVSMGGPPGVLWVMAQRWQPKEVRAFLMTTFLVAIPPQLLLLYLAYGEAVNTSLRQGVLLAPVAIVAAWLGVRLGNILPDVWLRRLAYSLLFVTACSSLGSRFI